MVIDYLEKLQNEFLQKKFDAEKRLNNVQVQLRENVEFIRLLEESKDPYYGSFSPRDMSPGNQEKIRSLHEEHEKLEKVLEEEKAYYEDYAKRLEELSVVVADTKKKMFSNNQDMLNDRSYRIKLLETQENERQRISRELHDSTVQNLTGLVHKTELCSKLVELDPIRCKLELNMMSKTLRDIIGDTRNLIYNLRPMSFDDIGLDVTIERAIEKLEGVETKKISFCVEGEPYQIKSVVGITLLRIIQEGCSNAIQHANPSMIQVVLKYDSDYIEVRIEDDGMGFDTEKVINSRGDNSGFGLSMMKERVYLLLGNITIDSSHERGTKIVVNIPIKNEEED